MSDGDTSAVPPLEDDRAAMMLGLVPDKRTPEERLLDAIETNGESLNYRYSGPINSEAWGCGPVSARRADDD